MDDKKCKNVKLRLILLIKKCILMAMKIVIILAGMFCLFPLAAQDESEVLYFSSNGYLVTFSETFFADDTEIFFSNVHTFIGLQFGKVDMQSPYTYTYTGIQLAFCFLNHSLFFLNKGHYVLDPLILLFEFFNYYTTFEYSRVSLVISIGALMIFGIKKENVNHIDYPVNPLQFPLMSSSWIELFPDVNVDAFPSIYINACIILPPWM